MSSEQNQVKTEYMDFIGTTQPADISEITDAFHFGDDNIDSNGVLSSCHAFFRCKNAPEGISQTIVSIIIGSHDEYIATKVIPVREKKATINGEGWYSIDGRKLNGTPQTKGLYIYNGQAVYIAK